MATADDWGSEAESNDDWGYDGESYDSESLRGSSNVVDKEGHYHFEIVDVKPELDVLNAQGHPKSPAICFHCNVLHSVAGQSPAGHMLFHRIYLASKGGGPPAEGAAKSGLRFGLGLGLLKYTERDGREIVVEAGTGQSRIRASLWQQAKGKQFIAQVKLEKGEGDYKDKYTIPFGEVYYPADPKVVDVPKNAEALAMIGIIAAKGSSSPLPTAKAANVANDEFSDV